MPKKLDDPNDKKVQVSLALKKKTLVAIDKNLEKLANSVIRKFDIEEVDLPKFKNIFSRSAFLQEIAEMIATENGYKILEGSFLLAVESMGFQQKNPNQMDMFDD